MNLNFTMSELIRSDHAKKHGIINTPNVIELDNLLNLIVYCLQPIRNIIKKPIIVTSGYRCKQLNKLVKGKANSQHIEGKAADFVVRGEAVKEVISKIQESEIEYDQLINEHDKWIHISFNKGNNRKQYIKL